MGFLGSLIIDLVLLLFLVVIIIYSVRKGFSGSTWGIVSSVLAIGGAFALGFIIYTFLFGLFGWVEGLENTIDSWFGGTSTLLEAFEGMGFDYDAVVKYTAMGLCIVLLFIPCYFLINLLFKGIGKLWGYVRKLGLFKFLDNFLGVIANVAIIVCLILGVFALIYNLKGEFFVNARELIKSTYLTRFIYKFNPLNSFLSF